MMEYENQNHKLKEFLTAASKDLAHFNFPIVKQPQTGLCSCNEKILDILHENADDAHVERTINYAELVKRTGG